MNKIILFLGVLLTVVLTSGCETIMKSLQPPQAEAEIRCEEKKTETNDDAASLKKQKAQKAGCKKKIK